MAKSQAMKVMKSLKVSPLKVKKLKVKKAAATEKKAAKAIMKFTKTKKAAKEQTIPGNLPYRGRRESYVLKSIYRTEIHPGHHQCWDWEIHIKMKLVRHFF